MGNGTLTLGALCYGCIIQLGLHLTTNIFESGWNSLWVRRREFCIFIPGTFFTNGLNGFQTKLQVKFIIGAYEFITNYFVCGLRHSF